MSPLTWKRGYRVALGGVMGLAVLLGINLPRMHAAPAANNVHPTYKVGFTVREFVPPEPYDWRGSMHHALLTMI